jgi:ribosomal protein S18 acetylase RimI-like enzyme
MSYNIDGPCLEKGAACELVLRALPDWFGIESAVVQYGKDIDLLPTFLVEKSGQVLGFISLKQHYERSWEVYVMGVRPEMHRKGIGKALVQAAETYVQEQGGGYIQVKTLGFSHPDESYARTRAFYQAVGFYPLEEFPQIWDAANPCLILVKKISSI